MAVQLGDVETIRLLALVSYFWFCVIILCTLVLSGIVSKAFNVLTVNREMLMGRSFVCGISLIILSRWPVPRLLTHAFGNTPTRNRLAIIAAMLFYGGSILLLVAILVVQKLMMGKVQIVQPSTDGLWTATGLLELSFWPFYVFLWLLVAPLTLALVSFNRPSLLRKIIIPFAGPLWRLVEYEKGALSALMLIAAFVLGFLKLLYGS